ncbi:MAG TPA: hypothetical protein VGA73_12985 [Candidatus Binatia bacterium]
MKYEVRQSKERPGAYIAVAVDNESGAGRKDAGTALFIGPEAKRRAEDYAEWQNGRLEISGEQLLRR